MNASVQTGHYEFKLEIHVVFWGFGFRGLFVSVDTHFESLGQQSFKIMPANYSKHSPPCPLMTSSPNSMHMQQWGSILPDSKVGKFPQRSLQIHTILFNGHPVSGATTVENNAKGYRLKELCAPPL